VFDLVVRGGTLVLEQGTVAADLAVEDGKIVQIGPELGAGREEIDARGLHVFPGLIDVHVHFNEPGHEDWEGIATGSAALAAGGGTLFFDMPLNSIPCVLDAPSFDTKLEALRAKSLTDFALWGGLTPHNLERLPELAERGAIGFKAFMSNSGLPEFPHADDHTLYRGMQAAARLGLPVAVHAESEGLTAGLAAEIRAGGGKGLRDYLASRPVLAELEAIQRATLLAQETGCKLHIVHISSGRGVVLAALARARGVDVSLETCPHYLFFDEEDLERLGALAKCAPPLRPPTEREALWRAVREGLVDLVASDHSPSSPDLKENPDFFAVWGGIAGVQSTLAVLLEAGFHRRGLPLEAVAGLTAHNPARRFGLGGKGGLEVGHDADLALVDLEAEFTLHPGALLYRHRQSPYLGQSFQGQVVRTLLRGQTVFAQGQINPKVRGQLVRP